MRTLKVITLEDGLSFYPTVWWDWQGNGNDILGSNDLSLTGVTYSGGPSNVGQSANFTDDGDRGTLSGSSDFDLVFSDWTVTFWVKLNDIPPDTTNFRNFVISRYDYYGGEETWANNWIIGFGTFGGERWFVQFIGTNHTTGYACSNTHGMSADTWYHVGITHDFTPGTTHDCEFFRNGSSINTGQIVQIVESASGDILFGSQVDSADGSYYSNTRFDGFVADFRIYKNTILTEAQINSIKGYLG